MQRPTSAQSHGTPDICVGVVPCGHWQRTAASPVSFRVPGSATQAASSIGPMTKDGMQIRHLGARPGPARPTASTLHARCPYSCPYSGPTPASASAICRLRVLRHAQATLHWHQMLTVLFSHWRWHPPGSAARALLGASVQDRRSASASTRSSVSVRLGALRPGPRCTPAEATSGTQAATQPPAQAAAGGTTHTGRHWHCGNR